MKGKRRPKPPSTHYSMMDELLASTSQPMPQRNRDYQLKQMNDALQELMQAPRPTNNAWRIVSDAVNLLETLVQHGEAPIKDATGNIIASHWRDCDGDAVEIRDNSGLLRDATAAMVRAGDHLMNGGPLRLDGLGLAAVRAVLEDYQAALETLPHRTMVRCHRATEKRLLKVYGSAAYAAEGVRIVAI